MGLPDSNGGPLIRRLAKRQPWSEAQLQADVLRTLKLVREEPRQLYYQTATATPKRLAMKATCPTMSCFGSHRTWPLRIMFIVSIP